MKKIKLTLLLSFISILSAKGAFAGDKPAGGGGTFTSMKPSPELSVAKASNEILGELSKINLSNGLPKEYLEKIKEYFDKVANLYIGYIPKINKSELNAYFKKLSFDLFNSINSLSKEKKRGAPSFSETIKDLNEKNVSSVGPGEFNAIILEGFMKSGEVPKIYGPHTPASSTSATYYNYYVYNFVSSIIKQIEKDFSPYLKKYTKQEIIDLLDYASKDLFFNDKFKLSDFPEMSQLKELKQILASKDKQDLSEEQKVKFKKFVGYTNWQKALDSLAAFLVASESRELPPYYQYIKAINEKIIKLIGDQNIIKEEGIRTTENLDRAIKTLKEDLSKIQNGINNVDVFFKGPRSAKEVLQILVGKPKSKNKSGILERVIDKIDEFYGSKKS